MFPTPFRVVLDANVLFPFTLRDTLLRAAEAGYYQVNWTSEILDETTRNLVDRGLMTNRQAQTLVDAMRRAFPEAEVSGYETLVPSMANDPKDRHVAAAAVRCGAQVIVTQNLKDFRHLPDGIEAQSPSGFLVDLLDLDRETMLELLREQAGALCSPPKTLEELLVGLGKTVPNFVTQVRRLL